MIASCLLSLTFIPFIPNKWVIICLSVACWLIISFTRNTSTGPLRTLVPLEICQTELRVKAFSVATINMRAFQTVGIFAVYPLYTVIGSWTFLMFSAMSFAMFAYVFARMPETRNKTFAQISDYWSADKTRRAFSIKKQTVDVEKAPEPKVLDTNDLGLAKDGKV